MSNFFEFVFRSDLFWKENWATAVGDSVDMVNVVEVCVSKSLIFDITLLSLSLERHFIGTYDQPVRCFVIMIMMMKEVKSSR